MLQPITNQQPDDYKDPISQSGDKVRSCNNKVNKHMSSKLEDKGINGKNLSTLPSTKHLIAQKPNYYSLNNGHKSKQRSNDVSNKHYLTSCKALNQEYKAPANLPTVA